MHVYKPELWKIFSITVPKRLAVFKVSQIKKVIKCANFRTKIILHPFAWVNLTSHFSSRFYAITHRNDEEQISHAHSASGESGTQSAILHISLSDFYNRIEKVSETSQALLKVMWRQNYGRKYITEV